MSSIQQRQQEARDAIRAILKRLDEKTNVFALESIIRTRPFLREIKKLSNQILRHPLFLLFMTLIAGLVLIRRAKDGEWDSFTLIIISLTYTFACLSMAIRTGAKGWSILGAGLLATMAGDGLFYFILWCSNRHIPLTHRDFLLDMVRDLFLVGSLFVDYGLFSEWMKDAGFKFRPMSFRNVWTLKPLRRRPGHNRQKEEGMSS